MATANDTAPAQRPVSSDPRIAATQRRLQKALAALTCIATAVEYGVETDVADAVTLVAEHIEKTIVRLENADRARYARASAEGLREAAAQFPDAQGALRGRLTAAANLLEEFSHA